MSSAEHEPLEERDAPALLSERRARRAEHAELELRTRLTAAERRVAELEHAGEEAAALRARLAMRAERDARMADLAGRSAAALRAAREALDREILAGRATEAALGAERAAHDAAREAIVAERASRDALMAALAAERARSAVSAAVLSRPAAQLPGVPAAGFSAPAAAPASGEPADAQALIDGLARAAERLRAQAPPSGDGAQPTASPGPVPERPAGTLASELERALRNAR